MGLKEKIAKITLILINLLEFAGWLLILWLASTALIFPKKVPDMINGVYINKFGLGIFMLYFHYLVDKGFEEMNEDMREHKLYWERKKKEEKNQDNQLMKDLS